MFSEFLMNCFTVKHKHWHSYCSAVSFGERPYLRGSGEPPSAISRSRSSSKSMAAKQLFHASGTENNTASGEGEQCYLFECVKNLIRFEAVRLHLRRGRFACTRLFPPSRTPTAANERTVETAVANAVSDGAGWLCVCVLLASPSQCRAGCAAIYHHGSRQNHAAHAHHHIFSISSPTVDRMAALVRSSARLCQGLLAARTAPSATSMLPRQQQRLIAPQPVARALLSLSATTMKPAAAAAAPSQTHTKPKTQPAAKCVAVEEMDRLENRLRDGNGCA